MLKKLIILSTLIISMAYGSRFWAIVSNNNSSLTQWNSGHNSLIQLNHLREQSNYHSDGWGVVYYLNGSLGNGSGEGLGNGRIWRGSESLDNYNGFSNIKNEIHWRGNTTNTLNDDATVAMVHVRLASSGCGFGVGNVPPGPHPFIMELDDGRTFTFAHNGTVNKDVMRFLITDNWMLDYQQPQTYPESGCGGDWQTDGWQFVVDSELYFFWIMKNILEDENQNVLRGIHKALSDTSFRFRDENKNFVLSDGEGIWAFRKAESDDSEYQNYAHTLYWKNTQPNYPFGGYKEVMSQVDLASYPEWTLMNNNELIYLPRSGDPVSIKPFDSIIGIESKTLEKGWNWVGFPRLLDNDSTSSELVMEPLVPFAEEVKYQNEIPLIWSFEDSSWNNNENWYFNSTRGYKMKMTDTASAYLLPVQGEVVDPETPITLTNGENWINYFLPTAQSPLDALPQEVINHLTLLKGQRWFLAVEDGEFLPYMGCGSEEPGDCSLKMEYGSTYILEMEIEEDPIIFTWNNPNETIENDPSEDTFPRHFSYKEKEIYQPVIIEGIENGDNIIELGAFKDGKCVGAERVDGCPINLKLYAKFEDIPNLTYDVITQNRQGRTTANQDVTPLIKQIPVTTHIRRENSTAFVSLKMVDAKVKKDHYPNAISFVQTAPNPFNPKTNIQFGLEKDTWLSLSIFDIKGREIASLAEGNFQKGIYEIDWNGKNHWGVSVPSGMYFYRLSGIREHKKGKLLLLK